jgi:hypothetical protein
MATVTQTPNGAFEIELEGFTASMDVRPTPAGPMVRLVRDGLTMEFVITVESAMRLAAALESAIAWSVR